MLFFFLAFYAPFLFLGLFWAGVGILADLTCSAFRAWFQIPLTRLP
jgi:hypothetical protein